ncbi:MAG: translation initiation factor IF-2, partial [Candidatus Aenigmarchaeota archaeon ex4484_224]
MVIEMEIRSPIISTLGHVDHGKTTLIDKIRGTSVAKSEPGSITQHVGASFIPLKTIEKICGDLLEKFKIKLEVPGLLFIDTPGHRAFTSLRKRGGSIADLAILVIDINEGFQEQTDESLFILKEFKVPFVVAATKIDKIYGWKDQKTNSFLESISKQNEFVKEELDKKIYFLISQLMERGFNAERIDRVKDFTKEIVIVPVSGITGEGIAELLLILSGLAQKFLKDKLKLSNTAKGIVLEVKETKGLGRTIDIILYDGKVKRGDYLVIGGKDPIVTKVRALLVPRPLQELRVEKKFMNIEEINAAAGVKIFAPNLENVIAGLPLIAVSDEKEIEKAKELLKKEIEEVEFSSEREGVIIRADTLGSLEALIKLLKEENIPIRKAEVGSPKKEDVIEAKNLEDRYKRVVFAFNVKVSEEIKELAKSFGVKIIEGNIIYRLLEEYKEWFEKERRKEIEEKLASINRPVRLYVLPGFVFRHNNPAIVGVEVIAGYLTKGTRLKREKDGKNVGKIKE